MNDITRHNKNGGDVLVDTLIAQAVDTAFTVSGESFLAALEALRKSQDKIRLITTRHESGATFAAEAYGKLTGRPAAVFVSRGPGATNAAIGVHTAKQDSSPMLLFIGHVRSTSQGKEAFQEIDQAAMFLPIAKAVFQPNNSNQIASVTAQAVALSTSGRPGPAVVVLPRDLTDGPVTDPTIPKFVPRPNVIPDPNAIEQAALMINAAKCPLILSGEIVAIQDCNDNLMKLAEAGGIPVMTTYRRQDTFSNQHPAYIGHLEINRLPYQRKILKEADLLITVGSRLDGITSEDGVLPYDHQNLIQIYPDADVLTRSQADLPILSDPGTACRSLAAKLQPREADLERLHSTYLQSVIPGVIPVKGAVDLSHIVADVKRIAPANATILTDGGSFARWVHRFYSFDLAHTQAGPVSGAMGYGVPGAIGARLARPNQRAIAFVGDGGFMMTGQELVTAVEQEINLLVVVCDNSVHGSILEGQRQRFGTDKIYGTRLTSPKFADVATAYGCKSWTVDRTEDFADALEIALSQNSPTLIHLLTDDRDIAPFDRGPDAV